MECGEEIDHPDAVILPLLNFVNVSSLPADSPPPPVTPPANQAVCNTHSFRGCCVARQPQSSSFQSALKLQRREVIHVQVHSYLE